MITSAQIVRYISNRGWLLQAESQKFDYYRAPADLGFEDAYDLPVPRINNSVDNEKFLKNTLTILADIYELSFDELSVVIAENNSVFSIRIHDNDTILGKIGFHRFEELIDGLKDLLVDTASFVLNPQIVTKSKPAEALRYLNYCKFLQTEVGSFVAKIELPSEEIIKEQQIFRDEIRASEINSKLISVISYVSNSVFGSNGQFDENHFDENQENLNINLLKDLEKIYENTKSENIQFCFSDINDTKKIQTEGIYNNRLANLSSLIKKLDETLNEENQTRLLGRVINLKSSNPEGNSNEITIGTLLDQMPVRVKAKLSSEQYQEAVDAHKEGRNIEISGILKKMKTQYKFIEVMAFEVRRN